jgi:hypothetical protein
VSNDPNFYLTIAASNLKVAVPDQFEALLGAFQLIEDKERAAFLAAPAEGIFQAQGRANLAKELRERLEKCLEQRKNYQNRA